MSATLESTLSFFIGQTELFDPTFHEPLQDFTAGRDINYIDVGIGMEATSFVRNSYGATGSQLAQGLPWLAGNASVVPGISVESEKVTTPFRPLARNLAYSIIELQRSQQTGQPLDTAKMLALNNLYRVDLDKAVYSGESTAYASFTGLVNNPAVDTADVALNAAASSRLWVDKTPEEILLDINDLLAFVWQASGLSNPPSKILIPPAQYAYISSTLVSSAADKSILTYVKDNSITTAKLGSLDIDSLKFLTAGDNVQFGDPTYSANPTKDRMVAYTNRLDMVRFPLSTIQGQQVNTADGLNFVRPYIYGFGQVEFIYPESIAYRDGI